jgi:hypothetical protein
MKARLEFERAWRTTTSPMHLALWKMHKAGLMKREEDVGRLKKTTTAMMMMMM